MYAHLSEGDAFRTESPHGVAHEQIGPIAGTAIRAITARREPALQAVLGSKGLQTFCLDSLGGAFRQVWTCDPSVIDNGIGVFVATSGRVMIELLPDIVVAERAAGGKKQREQDDAC